MSPISITFGTPTNPRFQWFDSLKDLADEELDEIAVQCRSATAAIFTELSDRRNPWKDQTLEGYHDMLLKTANRINRKGLTKENELYLNNLHTYLAGPDDARNEIKVVRQFLWLVSRVIGWSYALLILCALGKHRLQKLDEDRRVKLVKHITQHRGSLFCPILEDKAVRCNLHQIHMKVDPPLTRGRKKRKRNGSGDAAADGTAPLLDGEGEDTKHHSDSEHCLRRNRGVSSSIPSHLLIPYVDASEFARFDLKDRARATPPQVVGLYADTTSLLQSTSGQRKCGQSDNKAPSIPWTDRASASYNTSSPRNTRHISQQVENEVKTGANQRNSYHASEVNVLTMLETASNSDILTAVSNTQSNGDTNGNSILPSKDIDYGAIVEPQNQVVTCTQSLPMFHDRLQDAGANTVVSGLDDEEVASLAAVRVCSGVRQDRQPMLSDVIDNAVHAGAAIEMTVESQIVTSNSNLSHQADIDSDNLATGTESSERYNDRVPQNGDERHWVGHNVDASGMLEGRRQRAASNRDILSESVDIGASTYASLVSLRRSRVPDPERPMALNNSSIGQIEIVLQQIQRYTDRRLPCVTDLSAGTVLEPEQEKEAFDYLRTMQDKLIYGVGIMVQKPTPQAWQLINEGFRMVDGVLLQQSRSMIRLLLRTFGGEGWDRFPELRTCLLRHFASTSAVRVGHSHPLSIILFHLQDEGVLESVLEQVFLVLLDTLEKKLDPTDDEMQFLRVDFCFLLRQRRNYALAECYGLRFLREAERVHGWCHSATRGFLLKVGDVYLHQKRHKQAIETFKDVLRRSYDALGTDLDIVGVYAHRNLSRIYQELDDKVSSKYHSEAVVGAALRIWGVGMEKFAYFAAEAKVAEP